MRPTNARVWQAAAVATVAVAFGVFGVYVATALIRPWQPPQGNVAFDLEPASGSGSATSDDGAAVDLVQPEAAGTRAGGTAEQAGGISDGEGTPDSNLASVGPAHLAGIAATVSQQLFPSGGAEEIVLVRDQALGDSLAAGSLIGLFDTTLLISGSERLPPATATELDRLGRPRVHILGGPAAISTGIEEQLREAGHNVHRHHGPTQADTAVHIADAHFPDARAAVLVRTPDREAGPVETISSALAATTMAAADDMPVLLTDKEVLSTSTAALLQESAIRRVIVIGNENEISTDVTDSLAEIGVAWTRHGGEDRFANAVEIARARGFASLQSGQMAVLVEGGHDSVWPAGFLGSVLASRQGGPVLLTNGDELPASTASYLAVAASDVTIVCTPGVTHRACAAARQRVGGSR